MNQKVKPTHHCLFKIADTHGGHSGRSILPGALGSTQQRRQYG
jgi:hypothetical protein